MTASKTTSLDIQHIARIEGHGNVEIKLDGSRIEHIELKTVEPARFFESIVGGRHFNDLALIVSRICGICSPNHTITGLMAVEDALGLEITQRTRLLRELLVYGSFIQNHATHLYVFAAPDYTNTVPSAKSNIASDTLPSVLSLAAGQKRDRELLRRALELKKLGNDLCAAIGGRPVHPVNAIVGGFTDQPDQMTLQVLAARLRAALTGALLTVELFAGVDFPNFQPDREKLALRDKSGGYAILPRGAQTTVSAHKSVWSQPVASYHDFISEHANPQNGNAKFSFLESNQGEQIPFMVGALARLSISGDALMPEAAVARSKLSNFSNPYLNNLCQAIELVDALERCAALCDRLAEDYEKSDKQIAPPQAIEVQAGVGYAASEAPRGTLYYSIGLDARGYVTSGDVITPTAQNLACIEADLRDLAPLLEGLPQDQLILRIEQLIRAYDPCLSCAVH
ncbi:MAG: Ni/Fe hydrogenase subunit alpha [Coriobacteriia bacterium]|nr:Ni/Fe hydrogenase subunit alpha [Coriobacteriia bacterium]